LVTFDYSFVSQDFIDRDSSTGYIDKTIAISKPFNTIQKSAIPNDPPNTNFPIFSANPNIIGDIIMIASKSSPTILDLVDSRQLSQEGQTNLSFTKPVGNLD